MSISAIFVDILIDALFFVKKDDPDVLRYELFGHFSAPEAKVARIHEGK